MAPATPPRDEEGPLVTEALLGVLEIAWDGEPAEAVDAFRARARSMTHQERRRVLDGLVAMDQVGALLLAAKSGRLVPGPDTRTPEPWQDRKICAALEPLAELAGIPQARYMVDALGPTTRAEVLLRAVRPRLDPA